MARALVERLVLEGTLVLTSPLSLGGGEDNWVSDIPMARNGAGDVVIPGTSIAGALRSWFEFAGEKQDNAFRAVWGFIAKEADMSGSASRLVFNDAVIQGGILQLRDHVGIDRVEGRAAGNIKFDRQSVGAGARFHFRLSAEVPADETGMAVRDAVLHIRDALVAGSVRLGGATTRGYGGVTLEEAKLTRIPLSDKVGFLAALAGTKVVVEDGEPTTKPERPARLSIRIGWMPLGPVMVKASEEGLAAKIVPLTAEVDGKRVPIIPGSSIKGVMRTMAERIMATVRPVELPKSKGGTRFREMIGENVDYSDRLVTALFGTASEDRRDQGMRRGKAALGFSDTRATITFSPADWRQALDQADGALVLQGRGRRETQVAIDRFTAAPAYGKLFSSLSLVGVDFEPIEIVLSAERLAVLEEAERPAALALLLLVLREMAEGQVTIGSGGTRGNGAIRIDSVEFSAADANMNGALADLAGLGSDSFMAFAKGGDVPASISGIVKSWKHYLEPQKGAVA